MFSTKRAFIGLGILPASILFAACGFADRIHTYLKRGAPGAFAVRVGNKEFTKADLQRFFDSRLTDFRDPARADEVKSKLLDSLVEEKLLLHQAERLNIQPSPQTLKAMLEKISTDGTNRGSSSHRDAELERSLAESLKMQQYLYEHLLRDVTISEEECETFYKQHPEEYIRDDVVHVREILVDDRSQAEKILTSLKANRNKNFGELARLYSKAPSAPDGGDIGKFQRGDLPEEFEKVVFRMAPGTVSSIVKTKYGYHAFLVEERILAHQQKFFEVKEQIREKLLLAREREIINKELESLLNQIPVEIHRDQLDFNYIGTRFSTGGGVAP